MFVLGQILLKSLHILKDCLKNQVVNHSIIECSLSTCYCRVLYAEPDMWDVIWSSHEPFNMSDGSQGSEKQESHPRAWVSR